jgi:hypothetical protein
MPSAQVVVTYELDFKGEDIKDAKYQGLYDIAVSTPWTADLAISADIYIYDDNYNPITEDTEALFDEFFEGVSSNE